MYLRHCLLVYGWQGQCLHFVLQRGAEWLLVSPLPELWYWAFLLPIMGIPATPTFADNGRNAFMVFILHGIAGLLTYIRWKYRWILSFSTLLSTVFVVINLLKPEIHDQSLMPALQSVWFIPHVTVYMFSYSVLGAHSLLPSPDCSATRRSICRQPIIWSMQESLSCQSVCCSVLFGRKRHGKLLELGPEGNMGSHHLDGVFDIYSPSSVRTCGQQITVCVAHFSFLALQMCWYGVNYLPAAQQSIHLYNRNN